MPTLTLHFETAPDADASVLAAKLQSELASLPDVEKAGAQALASRDRDHGLSHSCSGDD